MILLGNRTAVTEVEKRHRRTNRRTYVVEVFLIFGASLLIEFAMDRLGVSEIWVDLALTLALLFLVARAIAGRSHDLGLTDDWTLIPLAVFAGGWLVSVFWTNAPIMFEVAAHFMWALAIVSPAFLRGNNGENRFGSAPGDAVELKVIGNVG